LTLRVNTVGLSLAYKTDTIATVTRMLAALFAALTALASALVGTEHGVMVPVVGCVASITAGTAVWMASEHFKKKYIHF